MGVATTTARSRVRARWTVRSSILSVLRENRAPMRLTEIATATKLHLATTQRLVNLLIKHHYVERDGLEYRLGLVSLIDGFTYLLTNSLTQIAEPILLELTASTKLTSLLSVRFDLTQVRVLRVLLPSPSLPSDDRRAGASHVGRGPRLPRRALPRRPRPTTRRRGEDPVPEWSGLGPSRVRRKPGRHRSRGYAFGQGQGEGGSVSIAVPVLDRDGEVIAAIQVSGLIEDIPVDVDSLVAELQRASAAITRRIP